MLTLGDVAVVLCSYQKQSDSELSVSSGDLVLITLVSNDNQWVWCKASSNEEGFVPVSYIDGAPAPAQAQQQAAAQAAQQWVQFSPSPTPSTSSTLSQDYFTFGDSESSPPPPPSAYEDDSVSNRCYKVVCRYVGHGPQDLSVSAGELVLGTDEPGQSRRWVHSCRLRGGSGYVPKNTLILASEMEAKPWFMGQISRINAEDILQQSSLPMGTFLVRESQTINGYVISYKDPNATNLEACMKHRKINCSNNRYTGWEGFTFSSIIELVETHLTAAGTNLLHHPYDKRTGIQVSPPESRPSQVTSPPFVTRPVPPISNKTFTNLLPACPLPPRSTNTNSLHLSTHLPLSRLTEPPPLPPIHKRKSLVAPFARPPLPERPKFIPSQTEQTHQACSPVTPQSHRTITLEGPTGRKPQVHLTLSTKPLPTTPTEEDLISARRSLLDSPSNENRQVPTRPLFLGDLNERWKSIREELERKRQQESVLFRPNPNKPLQFGESQREDETEEMDSMYLEGTQASSDEEEWCLPPIITNELPLTEETVPEVPSRQSSVTGTRSRGLSNMSEWHIDGSQVEKLERLGSGYYGEVWKVKFNRLNTFLAMKTLNPNTMHVTDFLREAEAMKDLRHPNLVKLYAVCSDDSYNFMLIEYYPNGSVLDYLKQGGILNEKQKLEIIKNVAAGMKYLSELYYIHRDLAARNVLLADDFTARVADFGLAQLIKDDDSQRLTSLKMPWKWTAPEALCGRNQWSPMSDVWSYGVFCWELYTNCLTTPFSEIASSRELLNFLSSGGKLEKPSGCRDLLYTKLMLCCWVRDPADRISFEDIAGFLKYNELLQEEV